MRHGRRLVNMALSASGVATLDTTISRITAVNVDRVYHTDGQALLRHDQCHLATGHHTDADLQGIVPVEAADLCSQTAADDLGDQRHNHKADAEQQDFRGQAADISLEADGGKEDRRQR